MLTITPRTSITLAGALAFALLMRPASDSLATGAEEGSSILLASSKSIEMGIDATERRRVLHSLSALQVGPVASVISPEQLVAAWDAGLTSSPPGFDTQLPEVNIAARPRPRAQPPLQSQIPLGPAAIVWGARHPREAWRLFLPISPGVARAQSDLHAAKLKGRHDAGRSNTAIHEPLRVACTAHCIDTVQGSIKPKQAVTERNDSSRTLDEESARVNSNAGSLSVRSVILPE
jgi:hypothetical protein